MSILEELGGRFLQEALGFGVGAVISEPLRPEVQDLVNEAWKLHPSLPLPVEALAAMAVQGVLSEGDAAAEAALSGISSGRFHSLFRVNGDPIAPEQALDLWNRGEISEADVDRALLQSRLKPEWVDTFKLLHAQILQAADLASMVVQGVLDQPEGRLRAAKLGLSGDDFDRLVRLSGNPPGPETTLDLWNRGILSEADVDLALVQSRLKPEWVEQFKRSRIRPASTAQAVEAVVKERITMAQGVELAAINGTDEVTFRLMVDAAGRPMAVGQAITLLRRGEVDAAFVQEVIARSDVKTIYTDQILKLRTVYPSLYQVKQIISTGAITDDQAAAILHKEGYTDEIVKGVIAAAHGIKLTKTKELTQTAIVDSYKAAELTHDQATALLAGIGYDANDAQLILGVADYQTAKVYKDAVISVVRARFLQGDIDEQTARSVLDRVAVPAAQRDQLIELWSFDLQANPTLLTLAQLVQVLGKGIIDAAAFAAYLPRLRYQEPEISYLVALHTGS